MVHVSNHFYALIHRIVFKIEVQFSPFSGITFAFRLIVIEFII